MADTVRTLPEILALLADNTTGRIDPQDLRDQTVTVFRDIVYDTVALLLASTEASRGTGAIWEGGERQFEENATSADEITAGAVNLWEFGLSFTTLSRFEAAIARGNTYPTGSTVVAAGVSYVKDGGAELSSLSGWSIAARKTFYVDRVNGSDAATGLAPDLALQTISALDTILSSDYSNTTVYLARGSSWLESIGGAVSAGDSVKILAYGSGKMPILDCRDVVATGSMSKTGGFTNVYQFNWTPLQNNKVAPSLWETDIRLVRVNSQANCDSTAGSYFASNSFSEGVDAPVYFHPTASDNPTSSGTVYKQAVRYAAIRTGNAADVRNIHGIGSQADDGVIILGRHSHAEGLLVEDGTKHHLFMGSGHGKDCIAWKGDQSLWYWNGITGIAFIGYNTSGEGDPLLWTNCKMVMNTDDKDTAGFYSHGNANAFESVNINDCESYYGSDFVLGSADGVNFDVDGAFTYNTGRFLGNSLDNTSGIVNVTRSEWYLASVSATYRGFFRPNGPSSGVVNVTDCIAILAGDGTGTDNEPFKSGQVGTNIVTLSRVMILADKDGAGGAIGSNLKGVLVEGSAVDTWSINNCLYSGWGEASAGFNFSMSTGTTYAGDFNVYMGLDAPSTEKGRVTNPPFSPSFYNTATEYLAAVSGTGDDEPNSLATITPQFTGTPFARQYDFAAGVDAITNGCRPRFTPKYKGLNPAHVYEDLLIELSEM